MKIVPDQPKIAIIGTGALASLFGARLSQAADVTLIGSWKAQIKALQQDGLSIHELTGKQHHYPLLARQYPHDLYDFTPADFAIVLVKSYQTGLAAQRIKSCLKPGGVVLSLQNGLGNLETLEAALPEFKVSYGITMQGANITRPGTVVHAGNGPSIIDVQPFLTPLFTLFKTVDFPMLTYEQYGATSISEVIWRKLIVNAAINPLTALLGKPNGFLATDPIGRQLCIATTIEAGRIAMLEGGWPTEKEGMIETLGIEVATATAPNRSSMLQDVSRGGRTEIDSICGEVVARAAKLGTAAPINATWLKLIKQVEKVDGGTQGKPQFTAQELRKLIS